MVLLVKQGKKRYKDTKDAKHEKVAIFRRKMCRFRMFLGFNIISRIKSAVCGRKER